MDQNVTRRNRSLSRPHPVKEASEADTRILNTGNRSLGDRPQSGNDSQPMDHEQAFMQMLRTMIEKTRIQQHMQQEAHKMNTKLLERLVPPSTVPNQDNRVPAPLDTQHSYNQPYNNANETRRKARKAFSSHFSSKLFTGKFGDNWHRHCEDFVDYCQEWEIPQEKYPDYLKETLKGDALNFVSGLRRVEPNIPWTKLSTVIAERYANVNRQKEVSDRLHSLRFADFDTSGEDPATTLERIIAYIDKHTPIALPSEQTDAAQARFLSNATPGQPWALHAKGRISASASYEPTAQALSTSIRDLAEHEEGRTLSRRNRRGTHHRNILYKTGGPKQNNADSDDEGEPEVYLQENSGQDQLLATLENFFGSSRFARDPRDFKRNQNMANNNRSFQIGRAFPAKNHSNASAQIGCFNCGRPGCSVAKCPSPKDARRIAENLSKWRRLQKVERDAKINWSMVSSICFCPSEAQEVLVAATYLDEQGSGANSNCSNEERAMEKDEFRELQEQLQASAIDYREAENEDVQSLLWLDDPEEHVSIHFVGIEQEDNDYYVTVYNAADAGEMTTTSSQTHKSYGGNFMGACLDTGAQRSVCGLAQAKAYSRLQPNSLSLKPQHMSFKFGHHIAQSIGIVNIRLPQDEFSHMNLQVHVVKMDIPLIIGLDILKSQSLLVNYVENKLEFRNLNISRPITFKRGHVFLEWDAQRIMFTREELTRLHLHFMHPAANRLFELIKRVNPTLATRSVQHLLDEISKSCRSCQEFRSRPLRFKASVSPTKLIFNHSISIDLLWLDEKPALHVIDDHTGFRNAVSLRSKTTEDIWSAFVACWVSTYVGYPGQIRSDQESGVCSGLFRDLATTHGIKLEFSGVASHNSMGKVEQAHALLRKISKILLQEHPRLSSAMRLRYAVKALNDTAGDKGLVPSMLVFGVTPSLGNTGANIQDQG